MKKTKTIQLVLITAALASCRRDLYPVQPSSSPEYLPDYADSTYVNAPVDSACPMDAALYDGDYYPYYTGTYLPGWDFNFFLQLQPVYRRRGVVFRRHGFIKRGGFGKLGVTTTAS